MADRDPEGPPPPPPRSSRRDDDDRRHRSRSPDRRRSRRSPSPRRRRSRSPRRDRRRSRSPPRSSGRSGGRWDRGTSSAPKADPMAAQRVLLQQQALMAHAGLMGDKKQREVYVGNLAIGVVTEPVIRELFNAALEAFVPNPSNMPPVVSAHMSGEGRFAFVELRNPELANAAMALDKFDLMGRPMNVGRPKGYVPGGSNALPGLGGAPNPNTVPGGPSRPPTSYVSSVPAAVPTGGPRGVPTGSANLMPLGERKRD
eukprot:TRINITY_DN12142_c0_g2_i10.p2 TRINITY_DN12142_c0_g2~~TRINITY_DN12142_c0_g2_i10.p2  ORF type:complete len:257 (+),score=25.70 TRINITY_DN12142_c0_g2_i10:2104-2874(+)